MTDLAHRIARSNCKSTGLEDIGGFSVRFLSNGIGDVVMEELGQALEACLAVAFFNPDDRMLGALSAITKLTLIVSEEFTINNPYKLEKLKAATIRSVPPDDENGKLHAKVLIVKRRDSSYWTLLGSANLTWQGMFSNQEACVVMDSRDSGDETSVRELRNWFDSLMTTAKLPDLDLAKLIFDERSKYRLVTRLPNEVTGSVGYWALKTTSGSTGKQHWPSFLAESVIAIGWTDIPVDPAKVSDSELRAAIEATYPNTDTSGAATKIRKFTDMKVGDIVLLCRGYASTQTKDVHIHGLARVTGPFRDDRETKWDWRFKHDAIIQVINMDLPKDVVASALGKQSLMQTVHELREGEFDQFVAELRKFGVQVEV